MAVGGQLGRGLRYYLRSPVSTAAIVPSVESSDIPSGHCQLPCQPGREGGTLMQTPLLAFFCH
jgi:hypothetical protein